MELLKSFYAKVSSLVVSPPLELIGAGKDFLTDLVTCTGNAASKLGASVLEILKGIF